VYIFPYNSIHEGHIQMQMENLRSGFLEKQFLLFSNIGRSVKKQNQEDTFYPEDASEVKT
jgi:hypothetical protein